MSRIGVSLVLLVAMTAPSGAQIADPWSQDPQPATDPAPAPAPPAPTAPDPAPAPDPATDPAPDAVADPWPDPAPKPKLQDPETIEASQLPLSVPPPPPPYPRALVERPLILPARRSEAFLTLSGGHETFGDYGVGFGQLAIGGKYSTGVLEPYLGLRVLPLTSGDDEMSDQLDFAFVQTVYAGTRIAVARDTVIGVQGVVGNVGTDYQRYSPSAFVEHKLHPSERGAIELDGGVDYNYQNGDLNGWSYVFHRLSVFARAEAQVQTTPEVALEVFGGVTQYKFVDEYHTVDSTYRSYSYGADLLISVSESIDISPGIGVLHEGDGRSTSGGVSFRIH